MFAKSLLLLPNGVLMIIQIVGFSSLRGGSLFNLGGNGLNVCPVCFADYCSLFGLWLEMSCKHHIEPISHLIVVW